MRFLLLLILPLVLIGPGCGTSKWTDTRRSATEQLLITDAMDRAVSNLDFCALAGKTAYIDTTALGQITDSAYLVSCLRQHMLANACLVMGTKEEADYIVEVRAGAVGTDRNEVLYGVPAVNIPSVVPLPGIPSQVPEMPIVKKTDQRAVVKLNVFAYNRTTGRPIWQSGAVPHESDAKALWILGAGPFHRGSIFDGTEFAGNSLDIPLINLHDDSQESVSVADEAYFVEPELQQEQDLAAAEPPDSAEPAAPDAAPAPTAASVDAPAAAVPDAVVPAGHDEPATPPAEPVAETPPAQAEPAGASPEAPAEPPAEQASEPAAPVAAESPVDQPAAIEPVATEPAAQEPTPAPISPDASTLPRPLPPVQVPGPSDAIWSDRVRIESPFPEALPPTLPGPNPAVPGHLQTPNRPVLAFPYGTDSPY